MEPMPLQFSIPWRPCIPLSRAMIGFGGWLEHTQADRPHLVKAPLQHGGVKMPFPDHIRMISSLPQSLAPQRRKIRIAQCPKGGKTGQQHHTAGNADCRRPAPLLEAVSEGTAVLYQSVQIRCVNFLISQRPDTTVSEIVGNHEKEIRTSLLIGCGH